MRTTETLAFQPGSSYAPSWASIIERNVARCWSVFCRSISSLSRKHFKAGIRLQSTCNCQRKCRNIFHVCSHSNAHDACTNFAACAGCDNQHAYVPRCLCQLAACAGCSRCLYQLSSSSSLWLASKLPKRSRCPTIRTIQHRSMDLGTLIMSPAQCR